jgi:hypothetical protein
MPLEKSGRRIVFLFGLYHEPSDIRPPAMNESDGQTGAEWFIIWME